MRTNNIFVTVAAILRGTNSEALAAPGLGHELAPSQRHLRSFLDFDARLADSTKIRFLTGDTSTAEERFYPENLIADTLLKSYPDACKTMYPRALQPEILGWLPAAIRYTRGLVYLALYKGKVYPEDVFGKLGARREAVENGDVTKACYDFLDEYKEFYKKKRLEEPRFNTLRNFQDSNDWFDHQCTSPQALSF